MSYKVSLPPYAYSRFEQYFDRHAEGVDQSFAGQEDTYINLKDEENGLKVFLVRQPNCLGGDLLDVSWGESDGAHYGRLRLKTYEGSVVKIWVYRETAEASE